jgi:hypothetical protein
MTNLERVEMVLEAIKTLRQEVKELEDKGEIFEARKRVQDLFVMEVCLVSEAEYLVEHLKKSA